jgi:hypothetical protein
MRRESHPGHKFDYSLPALTMFPLCSETARSLHPLSVAFFVVPVTLLEQMAEEVEEVAFCHEILLPW